MRTIGEKLHKLAFGFVQVVTLILAAILFLGGFLFTCYAENMDTQVVLTRWDSPLWNVLGMVVMAALFLGTLRLVCKNAARLKKLLLCLTFAWIIVLGVVLILFSKTVPAADAMSVYAAAEGLAAGDTSVIHPTDSYLSFYPQQVGLMAFLEVLFRIWNLLSKVLSLVTSASLPAYHFIKGIYVLLLCAAVYFQYQAVHLLWENDVTDCIYLLLAGANLPMIMYSSFVYGEIPSFTAFSVGLYYLLKCARRCRGNHTSICETAVSLKNTSGTGLKDNNQEGKVMPTKNKNTISPPVYAIVSILFFALSVMLRKNSLILIIAVLLAVFFEGLRQKHKKLLSASLLYVLVCGAAAWSILPLVQTSYELRANNTLNSGVPAMAYFAMGMQEASRGCGWYNGFNIETYQEASMDTELANELSRQAIAERLNYFKEHPGYAANFYLQKHLSQWADGTYASRQATLATFGGRREFFNSLYAGDLSKIFIEYGNVYQNVLYLGALLFCVGQLTKQKLHCKKNKSDTSNASELLRQHCENKVSSQKETLSFHNTLLAYIGLIGVVGGFLFHIIWEANSRYIFVYGLLLMPYAAKGLSGLERVFRIILQKVKK